MKHLTLKDLAKELGISVSTVSRAFQPGSEVSEVTRKRVLTLANEVGFQHNPVARRLHQQQTFQIGIVVLELHAGFFGEVLVGIRQVLLEAGYQLLITQSEESPEQERKNVLQLVANRVDGLLISLSQATHQADYLVDLYQKGLPMVCFNRTLSHLPMPRVLFNDRKWAQFATEHLIQQGCKRIWHLAGPMHLGLSQARAEGYQRALHKYRLGDGQLIEAGLSHTDGKAAVMEMLRQHAPPDGVFAVNDPVAMGAMQALTAAGLSIPDEVAVIGFSAANWGEWVTPALSSVAQPKLQMGIEAGRLLLEQLQSPGAKLAQVNLEGELILRASSLRRG